MYEGGSLVDLLSVRRTTGPPTSRAMRDIAESVAEEWRDRAAAHTPVRTGRLRRSWRVISATRITDGYSSGVVNYSPLAHLLEYGVQPHELEPEGAEALGGPRASAEHPGHRGHHMLSLSAAEIEYRWVQVAEPHMRAWAEEVEHRAKAHKGIS